MIVFPSPRINQALPADQKNILSPFTCSNYLHWNQSQQIVANFWTTTFSVFCFFNLGRFLCLSHYCTLWLIGLSGLIENKHWAYCVSLSLNYPPWPNFVVRRNGQVHYRYACHTWVRFSPGCEVRLMVSQMLPSYISYNITQITVPPNLCSKVKNWFLQSEFQVPAWFDSMGEIYTLVHILTSFF